MTLVCLFLSLTAFADEASKPVSSNPPITIPLTKVDKPNKKPHKNEVVILDARPFFEYSTAHAEKAQPIRWEDFSQIEDPFKGLLDPDVNVIARKLRAYGISPDSQVIVLGKGKKGFGEEGRIAWMLNYVGVKKVKILDEQNYAAKRTSAVIQNNLAPTIWIPKVNENIRIRKTELKKLISGDVKDRFTLIDTRSKDEFDQKHIPGAIHIHFSEFINEKNEPVDQNQFKEVLAKHHVDSNTELIFYCTAGVRSGYATFVAYNLGFKTRHFDGGTDQWFYDN